MKKADRYSTHVSTHTPDIPGDAASRRDRHRSAAVPQRRGQLEAMAATGGGERVCTRSITYGTGDVAAANRGATADGRQRWCRWRRGGGGRGRRAGRGDGGGVAAVLKHGAGGGADDGVKRQHKEGEQAKRSFGEVAGAGWGR